MRKPKPTVPNSFPHERTLNYRVQALLGKRVHLRFKDVDGGGGESLLVSVRTATVQPILREPGLGYELLPEILRDIPPEEVLLRFYVTKWMDPEGKGYLGTVRLSQIASLRPVMDNRKRFFQFAEGKVQRLVKKQGYATVIMGVTDERSGSQ